jgi:large subunit ribosomal protein L4
MAKARYYKADGKKGRARALPDALFGASVNEPVLHTVVTAHMANQRQGTGSAKNRAAVKGGSAKPWKQKGSGRARAGTTRAAQWRGGGLAFPPQPHSWRQRLPRKVKALARQSALSARAVEDRVILIDSPAFEKPATRKLVHYLEEIGASGKVLLLTNGLNRNMVLSARNVAGVLVRPFGEESTYDILWSGTVAIERGALEAVPDDTVQDDALKPELVEDEDAPDA